MKQTESDTYEQCPGCGVRIYCGPIRADTEPGVVDICDVIGDSVPCPSCGHELLHDVEREWDHNCWLCGTDYAGDNYQTAEWNERRQCYRWWCEDCDDNMIACYVSRFCRPLARLCYSPLRFLSQWIDARWDRKLAAHCDADRYMNDG